ncbi:Hypp2837 [Branchiostoma lanceolatum]|uniref:Hypp2837 protein n=1 Tax=Branchiostoma lanceolatum TaxID=7740 RepID=A0A8K0EVC6_BRALA|nr:Hypp2837 [Branchiostoma lanceolatum]
MLNELQRRDQEIVTLTNPPSVERPDVTDNTFKKEVLEAIHNLQKHTVEIDDKLDTLVQSKKKRKIQPNTLPTYHPTTPSAAKQQPARALFQPSPITENQVPRTNCNDWLIGAPWRQVSVPAAVIDQVYAEENFGRIKALLVAVFTTEEIVNNNTIGSEVLGKLDQNKLCAIRGEVSIIIQNTLPPSNPMENPRQAPFTIKVHSIINARCRRIRYGKGEKKSGESGTSP